MHFSLRSRHLRPSLLASSLLLAVSAQGQEKLDVDLPAAPLGQAINALAQQSSVQILFAGDLGAGRQAPALKGRFTPEEALRQLLRDSGLKAQARDEHTFIVVPASEAAVPATHARSEPLDMEQMEITASRTSSDLVSATRQSTVIEHAQLEELRQGSDSLATVLAKAVPGMSDSSRTITEYGQTLRGRSMLVMVDGVPLNTNRDSSRNLANIDPALIERIEVIRGSSAIYGSGATGGIISITTRPAGGEGARRPRAAPPRRGPRRAAKATAARYHPTSPAPWGRSTIRSTSAPATSALPTTPMATASPRNPARATCSTRTSTTSAASSACASTRTSAYSSPSATTTPARTPTTPPTRGSPGCRRARSRPTRSRAWSWTSRTESATPWRTSSTRTSTSSAAGSPRSSTTATTSPASPRSTPAPFPPAAATSTRSCRTAKCSAAA